MTLFRFRLMLVAVVVLLATLPHAHATEAVVKDGQLIVDDFVSGGSALCRVGTIPSECPRAYSTYVRKTFGVRDGKIVLLKVEDGIVTYEPQPDKKIEKWTVRK